MKNTEETLNDEQMDLWRELVLIDSSVDEERNQNENKAMQFIYTKLSSWGFKPIVQEFAPGRKQLVVMKGTGTQFVLYLTSHIDSVLGDPVFEVQGDFVKGTSARDMKGGTMGTMDVLHYRDIPPWMTLVVGFVGDEELESLGMIYLLNEIEKGKLPKPSLFFQPEISTRPKETYPADKVIITAGRRGHVKTSGSITVGKSHGGIDPPSAPDVWRKFMDHFDAKLAQVLAAQSQTGKKLGRLGEKVRTQEIKSTRNRHLSATRAAHFHLSHMTDGRSVEEIIKWQEECFADIAKFMDFQRQGIQVALRRFDNRTSYDPYREDIHSNEAKIVAAAVDAAYLSLGRTHLFDEMDGSTSDANLIKNKGKFPVFESAAEGGGEHTDDEVACIKTTAATMRAMHELASGRAIKRILS